MAIQVRSATADDLDWLVRELHAFDKFAGFKRSLIEDEEYARAGILALINTHVVMIAENVVPFVRGSVAEPVGFIAAYRHPHPFNPRIRVLTEAFWWVSEKSRSSRAGALLLHAMTEYGRKYCDWFIMSLENVSPVKPESLMKRGFRLKESAFLMEF